MTKDELLERARDAHIEGHSSMTKDEFREAPHDAGVSVAAATASRVLQRGLSDEWLA